MLDTIVSIIGLLSITLVIALVVVAEIIGHMRDGA